KLTLPWAVGAERVTLARHAGAVELHELDRDIAHRTPRLTLRRRPVAAAHLAQRRRLAADVAAQQIELIRRNVQLVARVPALARRVLEQQVLAVVLHRVSPTRAHLALHELNEPPDA